MGITALFLNKLKNNAVSTKCDILADELTTLLRGDE